MSKHSSPAVFRCFAPVKSANVAAATLGMARVHRSCGHLPGIQREFCGSVFMLVCRFQIDVLCVVHRADLIVRPSVRIVREEAHSPTLHSTLARLTQRWERRRDPERPAQGRRVPVGTRRTHGGDGRDAGQLTCADCSHGRLLRSSFLIASLSSSLPFPHRFPFLIASLSSSPPSPHRFPLLIASLSSSLPFPHRLPLLVDFFMRLFSVNLSVMR
jgi:hypothetical protein